MTSRTEKSDDQYKCQDQVETQHIMGRPEPAYDAQVRIRVLVLYGYRYGYTKFLKKLRIQYVGDTEII